jgi:hypothetical protein
MLQEAVLQALFYYKVAKARMAKLQALVIIGAIVAGAAIAISLFAMYPDMMLKNTSLDSSREGGDFSGAYTGDTSAGAPTGSPQATAP